MNKHDSERLAGLLVTSGYQPSPSPEKAEVLIFNTCSVRRSAEQRFKGVLTYWFKKKKAGKVLIGVGGCLAQKEGEGLIEKIPEVNFVFGPNDFDRVPELIERCLRESKPQVSTDINKRIDFSSLPPLREERFRAWLSISTGCDNFCAYCIVPYVRGKERSRPFEEVLREAKILIEDGAIEITLLGQNVNSYGKDLYGKPRFDELLLAFQKLKGLKRLRFTTSHPRDFPFEIVDIVKNSEVICPHFHLPLQAGSDRVLKLMNRGYTQGDYLKLTRKIREEMPEASITTDIIVGFPGETAEDFQETLKVVREVQFDQAFTFLYSPREGTKAAKMEDPVQADEKKEWFKQLTELIRNVALKRNQLLVGRRLPVLIEGKNRRNQLSGRTTTNKVVNLSTNSYLEACSGKIFDVKITAAFPFHLKGELCLD